MFSRRLCSLPAFKIDTQPSVETTAFSGDQYLIKENMYSIKILVCFYFPKHLAALEFLPQ